jgi:hypothetical protein
MSVHVFGIRHHGPGSARSLLAALESLRPDAILIEGPPEGEELLGAVLHPDMRPPVAMLAYVPDEPNRAAFYPYAEFSPEWQAIRYGLEHGIPVRLIDLPQKHWLALRQEEAQAPSAPGASAPSAAPDGAATPAPPPQPVDPLDALALAAGYEDGENWWEHLIEERPPGGAKQASADMDIFTATMEMMGALRSSISLEVQSSGPNASIAKDPLRPLREAAMRRSIRAAEYAGRQRIAVVCGAWHAPALVSTAPGDDDLLASLPEVPVKLTWVAWSYEHLSRFSGYGAGAISPAWYEHLWRTAPSGHVAVLWLTRVAQLLRQEDLDASAAQVIDAARLADALAGVRGRSRPGLAELRDACLAVFCFGNPAPMHLISHQLIIGNRLGQVPPGLPMVPLYQDLVATEGRLRFPRQMSAKQHDLDLRQPNDLARSRLLHRLLALDVPWGKLEATRHGVKGTFHEVWTLQWQPEYTIRVIERAIWGNTIAQAANTYVVHQGEMAPELATLMELLDRALLADLPSAAAHLIALFQARSALSGDVGRLMDAFPPLARALRYGTVRQSAALVGGEEMATLGPSTIAPILNGLGTRICIGLPIACASLDDDAAQQMLQRIEAVQSSLAVVDLPELVAGWQSTCRQLVDQGGLHGLLAGRCCRLLLDQRLLSAEEVARRLSLALSRGNDPAQGAAWLEGLLRGSGLLLIHQEGLWSVLDQWLAGLAPDAFVAVLPLLRRTFSAFPAPERRQMGERVRRGPARMALGDQDTHIDAHRADATLPLLARLLGLREDGSP